MAPKDDFIHTISDTEDLPFEEEEEATTTQLAKKKSKSVKRKSKNGGLSDNVQIEDDERDINGIKPKDDGAIDPDFELFADAGDISDDGLDGWMLGDSKSQGEKRKRAASAEQSKEKRLRGDDSEDDVGLEDGEDDEDDEDDELDLDDEDDEVLADDAFGMNVDSEAEGSEAEEEGQVGDDGDEAASDNDSVATPVGHPDDVSDSDDADDAEEKAKRAAFFAHGENIPKAKTRITRFLDFQLKRPLQVGLTRMGFEKPTPIQTKTIPIALMGKDVVGSAVTGSGKTVAFAVPVVERLLLGYRKFATTRVVILTPTRELAQQCHHVTSQLAHHTNIKVSLAMGGASMSAQQVELRQRPDVVVATPGRFIDHMRNTPGFKTDSVEILVLDEADRMLQDGFADELDEIFKTLPRARQTMLFSATMTSGVSSLIRAGLNKPVEVSVDATNKFPPNLEQRIVRLRPGRDVKRLGYLVHICKSMHTQRTIIFFRQKKDAHRTSIVFRLLGFACTALHGDMTQEQRKTSVEDFRTGKVTHLLATDLASRGLDIKHVDSVINFEAPQALDIYVHRVGRTARAGRHGTALTLGAESDRKMLKAVRKAVQSQGATIKSRGVDTGEVDKWQAKIDGMDDDIDAKIEEEKIEKQLAHAEMQVTKGENMIKHKEEIQSRPKKTWFETSHDKKKAKQAGKDELNKKKTSNGEADSVEKLRQKLKKKQGKLSNKDRKKLDSKAEATDGSMWKMSKATMRKGAQKKGGKTASKRK